MRGHLSLKQRRLSAVYFTTLKISQTIQLRIFAQPMNNRLNKIWEETVFAQSMQNLGICLEGLSKSKKTPSVKIAGVQAKVELENFPNTSTNLERYDFTKLLRGLKVVGRK
jgi:hypothetical protein